MTGGPSAQVLVGAAALAVLIGAGVAACQHQDDGASADPCTGVAYAIPAGPVEGTRSPGRSSSMSRKNLDPPPRPQIRKDPPRSVTKTPTRQPVVPPHHQPAVTPPKAHTAHSHHQPHHDIDLDVDLDGC